MAAPLTRRSDADRSRPPETAVAGPPAAAAAASALYTGLDPVIHGQAVLAHRAAVGDRHRVELEVELGGEVERHLLGPLGLDDALVLIEDRVLECLQHLGRLVEVVVSTHHQEPDALVGADRLGGEEVHHPLLATPADAQHDRVRQVQLVAAAAFGRLAWSLAKIGNSSELGASGRTIL